ncbi:MAG: deoxyuridine 5'-triphosphate nucleotidohydrolase [Candidatus Omnitrophica bacterium]|nr:deoxyuridine 5'-triphosphate nucleotidohydrolase [Candidatus Omnitrophota bacterium]MBU1524211.1 deoxyuridine 5'-triphosphate nucleotidohydrolase [Candidatus Omnitrophota bacterium]
MLNKDEIRQLVERDALVENYINQEKQLTPNGFDLTVEKIFEFNLGGALDFSNKERIIPETKEIFPKKENLQDKYGWWQLKRGIYKIKTNEIVKIPNNLAAFAFSRTSLLRMGAFTQHGVWDAGFRGKSEFILVVENPGGIKIKENARIVQLVFFRVEETEGYKGIYQDLK